MAFRDFDEIQEQIKKDVLFILDNIKQDRSFLNKHFQNSINNYFLEDYAGNFLKKHLNIPKAKDITKYVQNKYMDKKGTKYMKLLYGFIEELKEANQINQFKNLLIQNISSQLFKLNKNLKEWQSFVWKRAFSLFVHHFCLKENQEYKGIFDIWNSLFPHSKIFRKRKENVNHRQREPLEQYIDNVRINKIQNELQNKKMTAQFTTSEEQAFENLNNSFFGNEYKQNQAYPQQKQIYLKQQQFECSQQQKFNEQMNTICINQQKQENNLEDQTEINCFFIQKGDKIPEYFSNIPDNLMLKSEKSIHIFSPPNKANNLLQNDHQGEIIYQQCCQHNFSQINQPNSLFSHQSEINTGQDNEENYNQNLSFFQNQNNEENYGLNFNDNFQFNSSQSCKQNIY